MERDGHFWMSMVKKYEKRNYELDEQRCTLQQRLHTLKSKVSSSRQSLRDSSSVESSCSCCCNSGSSISVSVNVPSATKICPYKPKTSDNSFTCCDNQSINSMEQQYIAKLHDLVNRERQMKMQVKDMEIREKAFIDTLKKADKMYSSLEHKYNKRLSQDEKGKNFKYEKMTKELLDENTCLCDQLQDAKLELKQCMEKLQGPIARQMEQEKRKSMQLENDLKLASEEMQNKNCCYTKDVCKLQKKLEETTENLTDINALNETLQKQMCSLSRKYKELQKDLISQKINEAHTLERVNEIMTDKGRVSVRAAGLCKETQFSTSDSQMEMAYNLHEIARKLSQTLVNVNQCSNCSTIVPQDLKDTIRGIVVIADIVNKGCKSEAEVDGDGFNDNKPPSPPKADDQNQTQDTSNFENEEPVHDVNLDEPTKLNNKKCGGRGPVDAEIEILSSVSFLQDKNECETINKEKCNDKTKDVRLSSLPEAGDVEIVSEVEIKSNLHIPVETELDACHKTSKSIHTTTAFTTSGMLEVVTEGPAGIIETSMIVTPCGSVEVITKIVDYPDDLKSEILSIATELSSIKEKISAAAAKDVVLVSDFQFIDATVDEVSSLSITLSEKFTEFGELLPPAEPVWKKLKELETEIEIIYEQGGGGEIEEFKVEIEVTELPLIKKLGKLLQDANGCTFNKTEIGKKVEEVMEEAHGKVANALEKANHDLAEAMVKANQDVETALVSVLVKESKRESFEDKGFSITSSSLTTTAILSESPQLNRGFESTLDRIEVLSREFKTAGGDVLDSVPDTDIKKIEKVQISREGVQIMANLAECDCDSCLCGECSKKIMDTRSGKTSQPNDCTCSPDCTCKICLEKGDASNMCQKEHAPDCDCVDCLCKPCAKFPADYKTRVHPPGCDCVDCLCTASPCCDGRIAPPTQTDSSKNIDVEQHELSVAVAMEPENLEMAQHNSNCECDTCKCCKCEKGKQPCDTCDVESHVSTCTCIDCLLTCGTRGNVTEKVEHSETCVCRECDKVCDDSCNVQDKCRSEEIGHGFDCNCSACKLACGDECDMNMPPTLESTLQRESLIRQDENKSETLQTTDVKPSPVVIETPKQIEENVEFKQHNTREAECDCFECKSICDNPSCAQIIKIKQETENLHRDSKMKKDLKDLETCLNKIECACAEAEATACKTSRSKGALMTFRNVVENLQEKCKEKDKVIWDMIKEMKSRMDKNVFLNLLGLSSKEPEVITQNDIYCCACDEDRTKLEDVSYNPCSCDSSDSVTDSSSCSCCTEFEEVEEAKTKNYKRSMFGEDKNTYAKSSMTDPDIKSASDSTCHYQEKSVGTDKKRIEKKPTKLKELGCACYTDIKKFGSSPGEPQKVRVCMKADTLQQEIKNALLSITEMRKIADALLIKWSRATCKNLSGYEVVIDGQVKSKIRSPDRTSTLIYSVTSKKPITVTVYALSSQGRCLPAAKAVFDA